MNFSRRQRDGRRCQVIDDDEDYAFNLQVEEISKLGNLGIPQQQPQQQQQQQQVNSEVSTEPLQDSDGEQDVSCHSKKRKGKKIISSDSDVEDNESNEDLKSSDSSDENGDNISVKSSSRSKKRGLQSRAQISYREEESEESDRPVKHRVIRRTPDKNEKENRESTPENEFTPSRKSTRLQSRDTAKKTKKTPERRAYLEEISPHVDGPKTSSGIRRKLYSNNLVMGRNSYNTERGLDLIEDSDSDDDFIVNDDEEDREEHRKRKRRKMGKAKKILDSSDSSEENLSDDSSPAQNSETPLSTKSKAPKEKKIFPKRNKKKHYEKSLEMLKGKRRGNKHEKIIKFKSSPSSSSSEHDLCEQESDVSSENDIFKQKSDDDSDDNFIVDDDDNEIDMSQEEDVDEALKEVISVLKRKKKGKHLQKPPSIEVPRTLQYHSTSSSDNDVCDDEPVITETDSQFIDIISQNDIAGAEEFLKIHNNAINKCLRGNKTALHMAAISGHIDMVEFLVGQGASTSVEDTLKYRPLGYAAKNKHPNCLNFLLNKTDLGTFSRDLYKKFNGINLVHLIVSEALDKRDNLVQGTLECLQVLHGYKRKMFLKFLVKTDNSNNTPLRQAVIQDDDQVVAFLLKYIDKTNTSNECVDYTTEEGGNILHFAVKHHSSRCLAELISEVSDRINESDNYGFTPLMYAAELSDQCVEVLLNFNASVHVKDRDDVTPLHLAASSGNLQSIKLLLKFGHKVDYLDKHGWPPLLYANFRASEECVITLFEKNPRQIFCLGNLINARNDEQRRKNTKIIQDTLLSISHVDTYYTLFNDFIGQNLSLLDENNHGCFTKTWRMILSFKNKVKWLRLKSNQLWLPSYLKVDRSRVLESALEQLPHNFKFHGMNVTFDGEEGTCLGPKREFCSLLVEDLIKPDRKLFTKADGEQYFPVPNAYFLEKMKESPSENFLSANEKLKFMRTGVFDGIEIGHNITDEAMASINLGDGEACDEAERHSIKRITKTLKECQSELDQHFLEIMHFAGQFAAQVVMDDEIFINLQLSKPFVKHILGIKLSHPEEMSEYDHQMYSSIKDNNIDDLDVLFSAAISNPWNGKLEETLLGDAKEDKSVTEENKQQYLSELSQFKLCTSISRELVMFQKGFYSAIRQDVINIFNADEFSLLLNGVTKIDILDWKKNTKLVDGWSSSSCAIKWFWKVVSGLKEEEKSLLLKFATGSPCVPAGGFSQLMGLSGPTLFTIARRPELDKLPEASTCFNRLTLPGYSSEKILREKILIAIRHGCEGFAFV